MLACGRGNTEIADFLIENKESLTLEDLKKAIEGDDPEEIKSKTEALATASQKLGEVVYQQAQSEAEAGGEGAADSDAQEDDVVDAEFEEVDDEKKE